MAAPKGNEYYLLRKKDGRNKDYTPEELLDKANEYFQWCLDNPLKEQHLVKYKDSFETTDLDKMRPFSIQGFCNFAEIINQTFLNYENPKIKEGEEMTQEGKDFIEVITRIRGIIENQQFEGAASGFLNPNIIARKLGLVDRKDVKSDNKALTNDIKIEIISPDE